MSVSRSISPISCRLHPLHPLAQVVFQFGLFDTPLALVLTYPSFLVPFCTWLLIGYFNPSRMSWRMRPIDGATRADSCAGSRCRSPYQA